MNLEKIISTEEPVVPTNVNEDGMPIVDPEILRKLETKA